MGRAAASLTSLLRPKSIAIIGASADLDKVSGRPLKHLLEKGYAGYLYPVNPRCTEIAGVACYRSIDELPRGIDLAVVVLPAHVVIDTVRMLGRKGVPIAVVFASGFAETGDKGAALEKQLKQAAEKAGVRLLGPNCLGLFNAFERVIATFSQYVDGDVPEGPAGFVSQSGAFGTAISALARSRNMGFGYFVNTGNEVDVTFVDAMEQVLVDERIRVCAGYIEGLKDGEGLCRLADQALELGKPLVLTKVGRLGAGARAAASHTGSLAGEDAVFDGVARQKGIIRARNEEHMLDLVEVLANCSLPAGRGVGVATQSGGAGVLIADRAEELGLDMPSLQPATKQAIKGCIPAFGSTGNPVDVTGQFVADPAVLSESVVHLLADPNVDVGIIWLQLMHSHVDTLIRIFEDVKARVQKPFVVAWVAAPVDAVEALRTRGIAVLRGAEPAVDAVAGLVDFAEARRRRQQERGYRDKPRQYWPPLPATHGVVPTVEAVELLRQYGVEMAPVRLARAAEQARTFADELGYPIVMKIESPDILHKTDVDGVRLNLDSPAAVEKAYGELTASVRDRQPDAYIEGVIIQPMCTGDVEFVVGLKEDPVFGAVIMMGLGGVLIEALKDVVFGKCPLTPSDAEHMLDRLQGAAVLGAMRGRQAIDRHSLVDTLCKVSSLGASAKSCLQELDLNPILLSHDGVSLVDVVLVVSEDAVETEAVV